MTSSTQTQRNPLQQAGRAVAVVFSLVIIAVIAFFCDRRGKRALWRYGGQYLDCCADL